MIMASSKAAFFLAANLLLFFYVASAHCGYCRTPSPPPPPIPTPCPPGPIGPIPSPSGTCPLDTLKLRVCANVLNGLINIGLGQPSKKPCCSLINGLVDLDAAVCLCTALKANILGIYLNLPIDLSLLLNYCGKRTPKEFQCA